MTRNSRSGQAEIVIAVLIALGILVLAGTGIAPSKKTSVADKPSDSQKEGVADPLPAEGDTYYISGNGSGPEIYEATIAPLGAVKPGVTQNWTVRVRHEKPVQSVAVTVTMDNGSYPVMLRLSGGTNFDGVWRGFWEVKDNRNHIYDAIIEAKSEVDFSRVGLSFPPAPPINDL